MAKVLIVDDSKFSRNINKKMLENLGHSVIGEAVDGFDGIQKFQELTPDLIVTDLEMPNLDGAEMIEKLRGMNIDVPIVVISSVVNSQVVQKVVKLKAVHCKKPIKDVRLDVAIKLLMH